MSEALQINFRPATDRDVEFLSSLRKTTMSEVVARHHPWRDDEQDQRVMVHFKSARLIIYEGQEIGLLKAVRETDHVLLCQIQLLPTSQGRGIGTQIITPSKPSAANSICRSRSMSMPAIER